MVEESAELVRRRGRWASFRIMEIYLQEVMAATYLNDIPRTAYQKVMMAFQTFPQMFVQAQKFDACRIPENIWFYMISRASVDDL